MPTTYNRDYNRDRREDFYPTPLYKSLIKAEASEMNKSRSAIIEEAVKHYFDSMPKDKMERLLSRAKNSGVEQR